MPVLISAQVSCYKGRPRRPYCILHQAPGWVAMEGVSDAYTAQCSKRSSGLPYRASQTPVLHTVVSARVGCHKGSPRRPYHTVTWFQYTGGASGTPVSKYFTCNSEMGTHRLDISEENWRVQGSTSQGAMCRMYTHNK